MKLILIVLLFFAIISRIPHFTKYFENSTKIYISVLDFACLSPLQAGNAVDGLLNKVLGLVGGLIGDVPVVGGLVEGGLGGRGAGNLYGGPPGGGGAGNAYGGAPGGGGAGNLLGGVLRRR